MKKLTFVLALLIIFVHKTTGDEQKFKVTFSISFDEMTLSQAAEIEKNIRSKFEKNKGCTIFVNLSNDRTALGIPEPPNLFTLPDHRGWWITPNNGIDLFDIPGHFNLDSTLFKTMENK